MAELASVAQRWNGFSVARLQAICQALPDVAEKQKLKTIGLREWNTVLREVQGRKGDVPSDAMDLAEMVLHSQVRTSLELIATRLKDVARIEDLGGTMPGGVMFLGPPGTGKTAAAKALAKSVGWAFLPASGADLVAQRGKLEELYAQAKDLRPALIFIDEADDILRHRQYSGAPEIVNKMLTLMDGTSEKVKDVVWLVATNHPEDVDPALMRAGRFTEKIAFSAPPASEIPPYIDKWLLKRKVRLSDGLDVQQIADLLHGQTVANVDGVLQFALNAVIAQTRPDEPLVVSRDTLKLAFSTVLQHQEPT
jgi:transitional endoplasmic reticulum ATPase